MNDSNTQQEKLAAYIKDMFKMVWRDAQDERNNKDILVICTSASEMVMSRIEAEVSHREQAAYEDGHGRGWNLGREDVCIDVADKIRELQTYQLFIDGEKLVEQDEVAAIVAELKSQEAGDVS